LAAHEEHRAWSRVRWRMSRPIRMRCWRWSRRKWSGVICSIKAVKGGRMIPLKVIIIADERGRELVIPAKEILPEPLN
jgi:hypothetical protein